MVHVKFTGNPFYSSDCKIGVFNVSKVRNIQTDCSVLFVGF